MFIIITIFPCMSLSLLRIERETGQERLRKQHVPVYDEAIPCRSTIFGVCKQMLLNADNDDQKNQWRRTKRSSSHGDNREESSDSNP